jgi:hypothetical protein
MPFVHHTLQGFRDNFKKERNGQNCSQKHSFPSTDMKQTTQLHLVSRCRLQGAVSQLSHVPDWQHHFTSVYTYDLLTKMSLVQTMYIADNFWMNWEDVNKRDHCVIWCIIPGRTEENGEEHLMTASFRSQIWFRTSWIRCGNATHSAVKFSLIFVKVYRWTRL